MIKYYHYKECRNCGNDIEEYIVRAYTETEALLTISQFKLEAGTNCPLVNRKYLNEISLHRKDIIKLT